MAIQDKLKIDELLKIRRMGKSAARRYLTGFDLDPTETAQALSLALDEEPDKENDTRLWMAVAHVLGASFAEIAADYRVARQSVLARVDRILPVTTRRRKRISLTLPLEHYAEYKVKFFENVDDLRHLPPEEIGVWLYANTSLDQVETEAKEGGEGI